MFDMCESIVSFDKVAHQMWHNHPFGQRNKTTERAVGVAVGGNTPPQVGQNLEKMGGVDNTWALHKIGNRSG